MIKIKTKHGGVDDVVVGEDGHWSYTYVPQSEDDFACVVHSGRPANEVISKLQLEDGTRATHWVPNTVKESELAKILKDQREIRLDFTNDVDQLEGKFQIHTNGILAEFKDLETKTESHISQTASNIRAEVKDDVNKLESLVNLNSSSLTAKIEDQGRQTSSLVSQTANNLRVQMRNELKDATTTINVSMDSLLTQLENHKKETSTAIAQTDRSIQTRARSVANEAIRTTVPKMIQDEVNSINYSTIIQQQSDNILLAIKDKLPESKMTGKEIVSAINLSTGGVRIKGETIALDGNTTMTNAFARKLMVDELQATDVRAFMAKFTNVVANNLDVNKLAGNKATFIQALFNGSHSNLKITGDGIDIVNNYGARSINMYSGGMRLYKEGVYLGDIRLAGNLNINDRGNALYGTNAISIIPRRDAHFTIATYEDGYSSNPKRTLSIKGQTGEIFLMNKIYGRERDTDGIILEQGRIGTIPVVFIRNHDRTGGIAIARGDVWYQSWDGKWQSLERNLS